MSRVCLVTHVVTPHDGQGRVVFELARYLAHRGHLVTLVASQVHHALRDDPAIRWIRIPVPKRLPDPLRWLLFAALARVRLGTRLRDRFDIVHLNGAIAPVPADINTCHFVHASWSRLDVWDRWTSRLVAGYQRLVSRICAVTERRAYTSARRVVPVSEVVRRALVAELGVPETRLRTIWNGVNQSEFHPRTPADPTLLRTLLGLPQGSFVLLHVGDAKTPRKNLELALEALSLLDGRFHLVVVGESRGGPYPRMARWLGVAERTHFVGLRGDVAECLRDADAVFCGSHYEPASLVLLEAMATGVPVITTPGVGNAAFVSHGRNGFLLRSGDDVEGMALILELLAHDRLLCRRIGRSARWTAIQHSWTAMGARYEGLYREILAPRATPAESLPVPLRRTAEGGR